MPHPNPFLKSHEPLLTGDNAARARWNQQYILSEDKDIDSNKFTLYADTRNIPSNTVIEYELYKGDEKLENVMEVNNNIVAANNINAEILLTKKLEPGTYDLVQMTNDVKEIKNYL